MIHPDIELQFPLGRIGRRRTKQAVEAERREEEKTYTAPLAVRGQQRMRQIWMAAQNARRLLYETNAEQVSVHLSWKTSNEIKFDQ